MKIIFNNSTNRKIILISLFLYLLLSFFLITPRISDELIYLNMAKALSQDLLPYRDFFFAHPPLQLFLLAPICKHANFKLVKLFLATLSALTLYLFYSFSLKTFKNYKMAIYSFLLFFFSPSFLLYSTQALGVFESLLFFLLGLNLIKKHENLGIISLVLSVFTRYLVIFLLPFVFLIVKRKRFKFFLKILVAFGLIFLLLTLSFGKEYVVDTFLYHFFINIKPNLSVFQNYMRLGLSEISICGITLYYFLRKKHRFAFFVFYLIFYHLLLLFLIKNWSYHYFVWVSPFVYLFFSYLLSKAELPFKGIPLAFFIASFFLNLSTLYTTSKYDDLLRESLILLNDFKKGSILGEPYVTNYLSFVKNYRVAGNLFDTTPRFIEFEGYEKIVETIKREKPTFIIDVWNLKLDEDYKLIKTFRRGKCYSLNIWVLKNLSKKN